MLFYCRLRGIDRLINATTNFFQSKHHCIVISLGKGLSYLCLRAIDSLHQAHIVLQRLIGRQQQQLLIECLNRIQGLFLCVLGASNLLFIIDLIF